MSGTMVPCNSHQIIEKICLSYIPDSDAAAALVPLSKEQ